MQWAEYAALLNSQNIRKLVRLHRWLGAGVALWLLVQAITGLGLLYRDDLFGGLTKQCVWSVAGRPADYTDKIRATIARSGETVRLERIVFPQQKEPRVTLYLRDSTDRRIVARYCGNGGVVPLSGFEALPYVLAEYHDDLLIGYPGHLAVMLLGFCVFLLLGSGAAIVWPARSTWFSRWPKRPRRARLLVQHRLLGLVGLVVLLIPVLTGIAMEWSVVRSGPAQGHLSRNMRSFNTPIALPLREVAQGYPPGSIAELRFTDGLADAVVLVHAKKALTPVSYDRYQIDLISGRIVNVSLAEQAGRAHAISALLYAVHSGKVQALGGKILASVNALIFATMAVLGLLMWCNRMSRPDSTRSNDSR